MSFNIETGTIVSVCRNHIKRPDSIMNTKQLYRSEIYFIRKYEQPWSENIKDNCVCVSHVFKTLPHYLTLCHNTVLRLWRLQ